MNLLGSSHLRIASSIPLLFTVILVSSTSDSFAAENCEEHEKTTEEPGLEIAGKIDPSLNELDQDDPRLIQILKDEYLIPPSEEPYNLKSPLKLQGKLREAAASILIAHF